MTPTPHMGVALQEGAADRVGAARPRSRTHGDTDFRAPRTRSPGFAPVCKRTSAPADEAHPAHAFPGKATAGRTAHRVMSHAPARREGTGASADSALSSAESGLRRGRPVSLRSGLRRLALPGHRSRADVTAADESARAQRRGAPGEAAGFPSPRKSLLKAAGQLPGRGRAPALSSLAPLAGPRRPFLLRARGRQR